MILEVGRHVLGWCPRLSDRGGGRRIQCAVGLFDDLIGDSPGMAAIRQQIERLLARASQGNRLPPVLLQGETGTGKGLTARVLHRAGPRATGPFVDVNCAAIPATLLEAEMFGFERGAFTDARQAKQGLFQAAHHGTLFLDEVGLLPEELQSKLLKVIEEREVRRLGSTRSEPVDAWILTATSENLSTATRERRFREDLYHRLAVVTLWLPPLRERRSDIVRLAEHYLARACTDYELRPKRLREDARQALMAYAWPGNVRELANVMERLALVSEAIEVGPETLGLPAPVTGVARGRAGVTPMAPLNEVIGSVERAQLLEALQQTKWNISHAAARLQIARNTLRYRIEKYGLRRSAPPTPPGRPKPAPPGPAVPLTISVREPSAALVIAPTIRWEKRRLSLLRATLGPEAPAHEPPLDLSRALEVLVDKLVSFGGRIEELSPSGLVTVFGLEPVEDAPTQAALAALAIVRAASRGQPGGGPPFTVMVALHVEQFVLARVSGKATLGEESKRAAWAVLDELTERAEPGAILIAGPAALFFDRRFELIPLGRARPDAVPAYRLGGLERTGRRLGGRRARFVGRQQELAILRKRFESAKGGQGQAVGIAGDAGIGKSRLLFEFRQSLAGLPVGYHQGYCYSYGTTVPYLPVLDLVRAALAISEADTPETAAAKVRSGLESTGLDSASAAPYLLQILGLKNGPDRLLGIPPAEVKARTFDIVRQLIIGQSRLAPLILVVEDLQWIDTTSDEYLASLAEAIMGTRILLVATYRPGYRPAWMAKSYATQMALQPLAPAESLAVVQSVMDVAEVPEPLAEVILDKAQGNPFFLEELARSAREGGGAPEALAATGTIEEVLLGRIERLSAEDKRLVQSAAVIGRTAPVTLLGAVMALPEDVLQQGLARLRAAEFIYETSVGTEREFAFKHALTHEVAYASLFEDQRRRLHGEIVAAIEDLYRDRIDEQIERLADHAARAGLWSKALACLQRAGAKASTASANREAIAHLTRGLEIVGRLPQTADRSRHELDLLIALGPLQIIMRGPRTPEVAATYARALDLCSTLPETPQHFAALWGSWRFAEHFETKLERADQLLTLARRLGDPGLLLQAHHCQWASLFHLGQHEACCEHVEQAVRLYDAGDYRAHGSIYGGHDPKVCGISERAYALWLLGFPAAALAASDEAMAWARRLAHAGSLVHALNMSLLLHCYRRDAHTVHTRAEELIRYADEHGFAVHKAMGTVFLGWAVAALGQIETGISYMQQGFEQQRASGTREDFPVLFSLLAAAYSDAGQPQRGLDVLDQTLTETSRNGLRYWTAELHRGRGELLIALSAEHEAEASTELRRALEVAREQRALSLELRAAVSLARLEQKQGRAQQAYERLASIYGRFREGFDTVDLAMARAVLAELSESAPADGRA
jgi:DNA-binding NtrC family response regulator/predicted ATPase